MSYVQASRARGTTRFFLGTLEAGEDLRDLRKQMERSRQKNPSHDLLERQGREAKQTRTTLAQRIE
ncbi:MAG TPA: hypothetical protein VH592_03235 [Gemmataceae bacterium]